MKLCLIGAGYVGLGAAAVFADWGNEVVAVDIDEEKIKRIRNGIMPIYEPGLEEIVEKNIKEKRLSFTTKISEGMKGAEVVFICVGTPQDDTGAADLSYVWSAAKEIGENLEDYKVIATKSTVPVGTNERVGQIIRENLKKPLEFDVASNPEFLREGYALEDMNHTDRTIIGSNSKKALEILRKVYGHLESPIIECDLRSAEMIKYASNAFLATKISFINEISQLCIRAGADVAVVGYGMGLDKRIGRSFLYPGIGYGGSCFPKDVAALYRTSTDQAYDFKLLRGVMEVNEMQREYFVRNITRELGKNLSGKTIACLGLAFKENTDDARESISIKVIQRLRGLGASVRAFDYQATENAKHILGDEKIYYAKDEYEAMEGADALCILTEWKQFRELNLARAKKLLKGALIFDGRNMLDLEEVESKGFTYYAVGRPTRGSRKFNGNLSSVVLG